MFLFWAGSINGLAIKKITFSFPLREAAIFFLHNGGALAHPQPPLKLNGSQNFYLSLVLYIFHY